MRVKSWATNEIEVIWLLLSIDKIWKYRKLCVLGAISYLVAEESLLIK